MTFGTPTTLDVLLNALSAQVVANTALLPEQVRLTLETEEQIDSDPSADQFLTIAPAEFPVNDGAVTGGGSSLMETDGTIEIQFYARYEADYAHVDVDSLTDSALGILATWRTILKSLHLFTPTDQNGNGLLCTPLKCRGWKIPRRKPNSRWIRIYSTWLMPFVEAL
jgi:hypothetical protein